MKMHAYLFQSNHPALLQRAVLLRLIRSCAADLSARSWRELLEGEGNFPVSETSGGQRGKCERNDGGDKKSPSVGNEKFRRGLCGVFFRRREHRHPSILPCEAKCFSKYFACSTRHEEALALFLRLRPAPRRDRRSPSLVSGFLFLRIAPIRAKVPWRTPRNLQREVLFRDEYVDQPI